MAEGKLGKQKLSNGKRVGVTDPVLHINLSGVTDENGDLVGIANGRQNETPQGTDGIDRADMFQTQLLMQAQTRTPTQLQTSERLSRKGPFVPTGWRADSPNKSPRRGNSPDKYPRREGSPYRSPRRNDGRVSQWEPINSYDKDCLQVYNIQQMESLYGKQVTGKAEDALTRFREQAEAAAGAPFSVTPGGTQTEDVFAEDYKRFVGSPYKNTEMRQREILKNDKSMNKLSNRHRVQKTPGVAEIRAREDHFRNDAILTEKKRTRFKDIIPQYDASSDKHCKAYFKRRDVKELLNVTRSRE